MKPFRVAQRKKNLQLRKASFNLKDFFAKIIESPDKMYPKLQQMLSKNSDTLHAFVELGGLSKIYEYLQMYYDQNDESQILKWLEVLNHDNFPIDRELISQIGLGNFINKQIKHRWRNSNDSVITLIQSIEQKWCQFAKREKEREERCKQSATKRVNIHEDNQRVEQVVVFNRKDKPSQIKSQSASFSKQHKSAKVQSILRSNSTAHSVHDKPDELEKHMDVINGEHNDEQNLAPQAHNQHEGELMQGLDENDAEFTLEYVEMPDDTEDIDMDGTHNESTDDEENDIDLDHLTRSPPNNHRNFPHLRQQERNVHSNGLSLAHLSDDDMKHELEWYTPMLLNVGIECKSKRADQATPAVQEEEERIRYREENTGNQCVELDSSKLVTAGINDEKPVATQMLTDYPHWSEIERYRREHDV
eukprot:CAMPEP_0197049592 /NCGR_PEP_ID=MMETSP1384-20130603/24709_1 /TAXON_ID=29189 /ORGANISM="Ammonia sp." /LENGTH=417 /DNA_ID=CAMNT_0042481891 /DNA_START=35 /DNA_END=1288 /DNA_ORIENTATION=-